MIPDKPVIALISPDRVGQSMAGMAIRYYELAAAFAKRFSTILFAPDSCDIMGRGFDIRAYDSRHSSASLAKQIRSCHYVISPFLRPPLIRQLKKWGIRYIADLYDPNIIEVLEYTKDESPRQRDHAISHIRQIFLLQLLLADHIVCASEQQKDLYIGMLLAANAIKPSDYLRSPRLDDIISLLPFGIPGQPPTVKNKNLMETKFPAIRPADKIVYWGGGIWNWFDPLSVIQAIEKISRRRQDIKLFFLGVKHPDPHIKAMAAANQALTYCQKHDLLDKTVFFNFGWTPYEERSEYLSRAAIGISTHFDNLETRYSFRTRLLDYIWAELPIITTAGDCLSELVANHNLGKVVGYSNIDGIAAAIEELVDDDQQLSQIKANIRSVKKDFYWDNVTENLANMIASANISQRPIGSLQFIRSASRFYLSHLSKKVRG